MRKAIAVLLLVGVCLRSVAAMDGIAISTHRIGGNDAGPGVHMSMFGNIIRHEIRDGRVAESRVLYKGKARGAVINQRGNKVAFLKLDGRICLINMDGTGLKELANSRNRNASAMDWPVGDWLYYSEDGKWPTGDWWTGESRAPETATIRRINTVTGEDEAVARACSGIWQLSLSANAGMGKGRFTITGFLADFTNPGRRLNQQTLGCGTLVSPGGNYVTEVASTHADLRIYDWSLNSMLTSFHVNEFQPGKNDGRVSLYRPRWSVNSEYWIVLTQGADFGCTKKTNMVLYDWKNRKQIQVTNNALEDDESDEGEDFWVKGLANDLADGALEGEAPFTVELGKDRLEGSWEWDFGDGTKASAQVGKHIYEKAGGYTVITRQNDKQLRQTVRVLEKRSPEVTGASLLDDRHVLIEFNEPIRLAPGETFSVDNPDVHVEQTGHKEGSARVLLGLSKPVGRETTIQLKPVRDLAQVPNAAAKPSVTIRATGWPTDRDRLAFVWNTSKYRNLIYDPIRNAEMQIGAFVWDGISKFDRNGTMVCQAMYHVSPIDKEHYPFSSAQEVVSRVCADAFTVEAQIATGGLRQKANNGSFLPIIANARDRTRGAFWLGQNEGDLVLTFASDEGLQGPVTIHKFTDTQPHHFVISYEPGKLAVYVDARETFTNAALRGKPRFTAESYLTFADAGRGTGKAWRGKLEGIAIYGRAMGREEAKANYAAYKEQLGKRRKVARLSVRATLAAATTIKSVADVAPYDSAFLVNEYTVEKVLRGGYRQKKIRVAQWGVIRKKIRPVSREKIGTTRNLVLELMADNPQFEEIFMKDALPQNHDLPLYVQVGVAPASGSSKAPAVRQQTEGPMRLQYDMPFDGFVTLVIESKQGRRIRNLVGMAPRKKGEQTDYWDCTNEEGQVVSPGNYRWRGLLHKGIGAAHEASYGGLDATGPGSSPNADPDDKTRVFTGGREFRLDYAANKATPVASLGDVSGQLMKAKGREYIMNKFGKLLLRKGDTLKPVAAMAAFFLKDFASYKNYPLPPAPEGTHDYASLSFIWMDRNDDGTPQPDEMTIGSPWSGWKDWKYPVGIAGQTGSYWLDENFNLYGYARETWYAAYGRGPFITRIPLKGWTPGGAPIWDPAGQQLIAEIRGPSAWRLYLASEGRVIFGEPITCIRDDGVTLWTYKDNWPGTDGVRNAPIPGRDDVLVGTLGCIGRVRTSLKTVFAMNSSVGRLYLMTVDGLFVASVFEDFRLGSDQRPKNAQPGTPLDGVTMGPRWFAAHFFKAEKSGEFYLIAGSTTCDVIKLNGLDSLRAIPGGTLTVADQDVSSAEALVEQRTEKEAANDMLTIASLPAAPAIDGKLDEYPPDSFIEWCAGPYEARAAVAVGNANLYLAYDVLGDRSPMVNGGKDTSRLFLTGDCVDLQLGTDPDADSKRTGPAPGDVRLLISVIEGSPVAVLYRWKAADGRNPVTFPGARPCTVDRVDVIKDAKISIVRRGDGYTAEAAVPLASLGFVPGAAKQYKADFGVVISNKKGDSRVARMNWANKATPTSDAAGEAIADPHLWGTAMLDR